MWTQRFWQRNTFLRVILTLARYSDIVSHLSLGSVSGIYSNILSDILSGIVPAILTYFLACIPTFFLALCLQFWHIFWHLFRHSTLHSVFLWEKFVFAAPCAAGPGGAGFVKDQRPSPGRLGTSKRQRHQAQINPIFFPIKYLSSRKLWKKWCSGGVLESWLADLRVLWRSQWLWFISWKCWKSDRQW